MNWYTDIFLWIGLPLLLFGYLSKYKKHHFRVLGYGLLGIFWFFQAPYFIYISDYVNAAFTMLGLPLFFYFAYNEYLSYDWGEDPEVMRFLASSISVSMLIYFGVQRVPIIAGSLIKLVAGQTTWLSNIIGYDFTLGSIHFVGNPLFYRVNNENLFVPIEGSGINIILACTALQTLVPAAALIYFTKAEKIKKVKSLAIVLPAIYIGNIIRNVLVIYLTKEGITSFDMAHNQIAKAGSIILLMILLIAVFEIMPKFHENIMSVISLPKREPIHQKQQR
ncbi:MAG: archaeosortase A [Thermoplasmatota archaeon]